jgi:CubicO group peptidase (beta-lactamase class C family)
MSAASPSPALIQGTCDSAFSAVKAAFIENFRSLDEVGAAVCIRIDGQTVVDLWGGHRDAARTRPWKHDTLVNAYSIGKGITAMLALSLVERGELDLDETLAIRWPEFGAEGKAKTTLRMVLCHQAGLPGVRRSLDENAMLSWDTMTSALAQQAPYWSPGAAHGYHVNTYGFLVGEPIVRRLAMPFSEALRQRLTSRNHADFHIGLPAREHDRVAEFIQAQPKSAKHAADVMMSHFATGDPETDAMLRASYMNPFGLSGFGWVNRADWRLASIPSTNGHGTARAVASLYDLFLNCKAGRDSLVGPGLFGEAISIHSDGIDRVLGKPSRFGLGFQLSQPTRRIGGSETGFGHFGYGGSLGFADPDAGIAFGYLMNRPGTRWQTPRCNALTDALNRSLGRPALAEPTPTET